MLVLSPIFEADLQPEQHAYRAGRNVPDAVERVHWLVNAGQREIVHGACRTTSGRFRTPTCSIRWRGAYATGGCSAGSSAGLKRPWWRTTGRAANAARTGRAGSATGVEDAGPCPAVRRGNRQLRGRLRDLRESTGGSDAGGGRANDRAARVPLNATKTCCVGCQRSRWSSSGIASDATTTRARALPTTARARAKGAVGACAARSVL